MSKNSMNYLSLENVTKTYGEKVLFDHISLQINQGDKVALVAKNGTGKSTLLRVIAGEEQPEGETARVFVHREVRIGYLSQEPDFDEEHSILEAVFDTDNPLIQAIKGYESAMLHPENTQEVQAAISRMEDLKAWDFEARIKEVLSKLNIDDLEQPIRQLSGGQKKRLALAKLIIDEPELLILDEPTNHLDLDMIEWLEDYLSQPNLTLLMVTHDRYFLERVCDQIIELEGGKTYSYSGNYSDFLEKKATRKEIENTEFDKAKKLLKKELEWVNRMPKARGTKAKSRVDAYQELKEQVAGRRQEGELKIDIKGQRLGKKILEAHNVSKYFDDFKIVEGFDYKFKKRERVGIVGPNGVGKTTFLKVLTQELRPDTGKIVVGENTVFGYYTQSGIQLAQDKRVIDVIREIAEYIPLEKGQKLTAEQLLERFLFNRKQQQVFVSRLSGGERRRLHLLTVLMRNPNFLILDEPTNDLDILTLNVLEDFLLDFPGCLIVVTHDRYFMDKIVDHLFVFEGNGVITDFIGDYSEYRAYQKEKELEKRREERLEQEKRKQAQQQVSSPKKEKPKLSYQQRKEMNRLEKEINKLEKRKSEIETAFAEPGLSSEDIESLSIELGEVKKQIEEKESRWLTLAELA